VKWLLLILAACHHDSGAKTKKDAGAVVEPPLAMDAAPVALQLPPAELPPVPRGLPEPPAQPRAEDVALGEALFFDPRLSSSGKLACATCHAPARGFSGNVDTTADGKPDLRRTPAIANAAWQRSFGWDGRFATLEDLLKSHVRGQLGAELGDSVGKLKELPLYAAHFARVGGVDHAAAALAAYVATRYAGDAPWDALEASRDKTSDAAKGYALFTGKARCATCHVPPRYADDDFHRLGIIATKDEGRGRVDPAKVGAFATPTLRGAALRTSFFHDGSAKTLEAAVDWHLSGGTGLGADKGIVDLQPVTLTPVERGQLLAFVRSLTGPVTSKEPALP